jgi:SAM-dependent methyltransferase
MQNEENLEKYESRAVVWFYEMQTELQPCEAYLFDKYLHKDLEILDMGVGGGRTTPFLSRKARRYIGADYSHAMVTSCRNRFLGLEFRHCDATDMSQFDDCSFDVVVFSFNGIDVISTDDGRHRCLYEVARVLRSGGYFIFSSHNAKILGAWPMLKGAKVHQKIWRIFRSVAKSAELCFKAARGSTFKTGEGYILDPVHGGMNHYVSTPNSLQPQLNKYGFTILEYVSGHYPQVTSQYLTPWYYYACQKT